MIIPYLTELINEKNRYQNMSEEEKNIKRKQARNRYRNMSEKEKNIKTEYARNRYHTKIKVCY